MKSRLHANAGPAFSRTWMNILKEIKKRENLPIIIAIIGVAISAFGVVGQYLNWFVPNRAELSIVFEDFSYNHDQQALRINLSGVIANVGKRNTLITGVGLCYTFSEQSGSWTVIVELAPNSWSIHFEKQNLKEKETTSFSIVDLLPWDIVLQYGGTPENFESFSLVVSHDDGSECRNNSREIPIG